MNDGQIKYRKSAVKFDKEQMIADFKTGVYGDGCVRGIEQLATKYKVGAGTVRKVVNGITQDNEELLKNIVSVTEGLNNLPRVEYDSVIAEANRILHLKTRRDKIAELFFDKIEQDLMKCETRDVKGLADALDRVCITTDLAPRFNPNSGTTVNQQITNNSMNLSLEDVRRELDALNNRIVSSA